MHVVVFHNYEDPCDAPNLPSTLSESVCNIITFLKRLKIPPGEDAWGYFIILNIRNPSPLM